jgi:hypothetical protein
MKYFESRATGMVEPGAFARAEVKPGALARGVFLSLEMEHALSLHKVKKLM